jgi:clan AA aspartic protease (TIGR02281 family)
MEPNASQTLYLIRTIIERCAVGVVGFSILMLIVSYHPDAATQHLETQYLNKKDALVKQSEAYIGELKEQTIHSVTPVNNEKPSVRLAQTVESFSPVPVEGETSITLPIKGTETTMAPVASTPIPSRGPSWFQTFKRSLRWNKPLKAEALPSLVDKPVVSVSMAPASTSAAKSSSFTTVPMSFEPKALFVKVNVNDRSSGHFILDTGATYTTISRKMAEELGLDLRNSETISITTANGELQVPKVRLKTVKVNNIQANNVEATVMDFENNASFSGLLGLSFIQHFKLTLDPQNGQMRFEPLH